MTSVVMVIAQEVFRDEEYAEPHRVLSELGASITTASSRPGKCIGKLGMEVEADISVTDAAARAWDAVAFIGGAGARIFFDDADAHRLARDTLDRGGTLAAICIAPSTLAHAGLLDGVSATAFPSQEADLIAHGAAWMDGPVTIDGRIVTANGPDAANRFGHALAGLLGLE